GLSGLRVLHEVVERVPGVGDLHAAVVTASHAEQAGAGAPGRDGRAASEERWPVGGAVAVARALPGLVVGPQIERLAVRVHEGPAEIARPDLDRWPAARRARG